MNPLNFSVGHTAINVLPLISLCTQMSLGELFVAHLQVIHWLRCEKSLVQKPHTSDLSLCMRIMKK